MANADKIITIRPRTGSTTNNPVIEFVGADGSTAGQTLTAEVTPVNQGTLTFAGTSGTIFTIADNAAEKFTVNSGVGINGNISLKGTNFNTELQIEDPAADRTISFQDADGTVAFLSDITGGGSANFNSLTITGSDIIFEGSTNDANETTLTVTDPTADRTIVLPDASGTVAVSVTDTSTTSQGNLNLDFTLNNAGNISATGDAHGLAVSDSPTFSSATLDSVQIGVTSTGIIDTSSGDLTIDSAGGNVTVDDNLTVNGNLTVSGTTTTVNTETIELADNIIELNSNETGTPSQDAGIEIERGTSDNVSLVWNETQDKWSIGTETLVAGVFEGDVTGDVTGTVSDISNHTTDDLSEGTNLYYTDTRARDAISASGDLSYNSTTGEFSFTERTDAEVRGLVSASGDLSYNSTTGEFSVTTYKSTNFDADFGNKSTDDLSEGTNLYYTDTRARNAVSASGDLSYNSTTGEFSFIERTDAEVRGLVSASGDLSYNSTTGEFSVTTYKSTDFNTDFANKSTTDLIEGTNLYYTDARVDSHLLGGTGVDYSSGTISIGQAVGTTDNVTFNDLTVSGNLTVQGTTTTVNTEEINLADNKILLNSNFVGASPTENGGIEIERGDLSNKSLEWNETDDKWTVNGETLVAGVFEGDVTGNVTGTVSDISNHTTDDLSEGTNLYYTDTRARNAISASGDLSYNSTTGEFSVTTYKSTDFDTDFSNKSTTDLSEGTNLYYTDARVDSHLSGGTGITYTAGDISVTDNSIGATQLDVVDNGTAGQALLSDGDGSFSWGAAGADITDDTTTNSSFYPTLSDSTTGSFDTATVSSTKLYFNPSTGTLNSTEFNSLSDLSLKDNIETIVNGLDIVNKIRPVSFDWKDNGKKSFGVIAQEIEEILPEIVATNDEGMKSIAYDKIIAFLIDAVKTLDERTR